MLFKKKITKIFTSIFVSAAMLAGNGIFSAQAKTDLSKLDNLVVNGGFEDGQKGWERLTFNVFSTEGEAYEGVKYAQHWGAGSFAYQTVKVEKNTEYILHFAYKMPGDKSNMARIVVAGNEGLDNEGYSKNKESLVKSETPDPQGKDGKTYEVSKTWVEVNEYFNSGDNDTLYLAFIHDWSYGYDGYTPPCFDDFIIAKVSPTVTSAKYYGIAAAGNTIKAVADVSDPAGDKISEAEYRWQISDRKNGTFEDINEADSAEYQIKKTDAGSYIRYGVVPCSETDSGHIKRGDEVFSEPVLVRASSDNINIDISDIANGLFAGDKTEAENCPETEAFDSYILSNDGLQKLLDESNALMSGDVSYMLINNVEKRAVSGANTSIKLNGGNYKSINVLMTYKEIPANTQKAVIEYDDDTADTVEYEAGSVMSKTDSLTALNNSPIGLYGILGNDDEPDGGYLYSYTFEADPEKGINAINFPADGEGGSPVIFAVTVKQVSGDALASLIEKRIAELPENITVNDRESIEKILSLSELYEDQGGDPDNIAGYDKIKKLLVDVSKCEVEHGLYDSTVTISFTQPVTEDSIGYDFISVDGADKTQYDIEPVTSNGKTTGLKITVVNDFLYKEKTVTLSDKIACANEPNFEIGYKYKHTFAPKKLFEVKNAVAKIESGNLNVNVRFTNNSDTEQTYYLVCGVYADDNEMIYSITKSGTLQPGESGSVNDIKYIGENAKNAKLFVFNNENNLKVMYQ